LTYLLNLKSAALSIPEILKEFKICGQTDRPTVRIPCSRAPFPQAKYYLPRHKGKIYFKFYKMDLITNSIFVILKKYRTFYYHCYFTASEKFLHLCRSAFEVAK